MGTIVSTVGRSAETDFFVTESLQFLLSWNEGPRRQTRRIHDPTLLDGIDSNENILDTTGTTCSVLNNIVRDTVTVSSGSSGSIGTVQ